MNPTTPNNVPQTTIKEPRKRLISTQHKNRLQEKQRYIETYSQFEDILLKIKPFGVYQIFACFCIIFAQIEWAGNFGFTNIVGSTEPDWICNNTMVVNHTLSNKCDILKHCSTIAPLKNSTDFNSIVATFQLICDDRKKPEYIQIVLAGAMLIGSVIGGHLGDWYGRQYLFYMCQLGIVITSCMTTASRRWTDYLICQSLNGIMYGIIEVESITLLMEYTNNQYRMIPNACYQWNIANMVIALIAYLTKDWQLFFVFLNLVTSPIIMMFMLFHESPRWLMATGRISKACNTLNDIANKRWNGTDATFIPKQLETIPHETKRTKYTFYHLFSSKRFFKQSMMQILSMFTYSLVSICYMYVIKYFTELSPILVLFLDGAFRSIIPILIIIFDISIRSFTRRTQFLGSLIVMAACFGALIVLVANDYKYNSYAIAVPLILGAMINDSAFWMNIVQVTTQRYPTVIRCIAFGSLHSVKHIGSIVGVVLFSFWVDEGLLEDSDKKIYAFIIPEALILLTLVVGYFIQPDTKGKSLLDRIDDKNFGRIESALPSALMKLATMHRVMQTELHTKLKEQYQDEWENRLRELEEEQGETNEAFSDDSSDSAPRIRRY